MRKSLNIAGVLVVFAMTAPPSPLLGSQPTLGGESIQGGEAFEAFATRYHDTVASRGDIEGLADASFMSEEVWGALQSIGQESGRGNSDLFRLASDASLSLTTEQRSELRSKLAASYLDIPEVVDALSATEFCLLIDACWDTGVSNTLIGEVILNRIDTSGYSQFTRAEGLRVLLRALKYVRSDEARRAKKQLVDNLWGNLLTDKTYLRNQDAWELFKLIQTTGSQITPQRGQQFSEFYMGYLFEPSDDTKTVGPVELLTAGRSLDVARKTFEGKGYARYTEALAKALVEDQVFEFKFPLDYRYLAAPLGTDGARQAIRDTLIDDSGRVRLEAAQVLGWAYFRAGELQAWEQFLDSKINDTDGDKEALWLLARSHCEQVKMPQGSALAGRRWVDSALSRAESEEAKLVCVQWLVDRYEAAMYFGQASSFLAGVQPEFESDHAKRVLTGLSVRLGRARTTNDIYTARKSNRNKRYRLTRQHTALQDRLSDAEASEKPPHEINQLHAMISQIEQDLAALGR